MSPCLRESEVAVVINRHDLPAEVGEQLGVGVEPGVGEVFGSLHADSRPQVGKRGLGDHEHPTASARPRRFPGVVEKDHSAGHAWTIGFMRFDRSGTSPQKGAGEEQPRQPNCALMLAFRSVPHHYPHGPHREDAGERALASLWETMSWKAPSAAPAPKVAYTVRNCQPFALQTSHVVGGTARRLLDGKTHSRATAMEGPIHCG